MAPSATTTASALEIALPDRQNGRIDVDSKAIRLVRTEGKAINEFPPNKPYSICIESMPVTIERRPYVPKSDDELVDPGTARMCAASVEAPNGTTEGDWAELNKHRNVVQQHCVSVMIFTPYLGHEADHHTSYCSPTGTRTTMA